jgi:hypothetical protein
VPGSPPDKTARTYSEPMKPAAPVTRTFMPTRL